MTISLDMKRARELVGNSEGRDSPGNSSNIMTKGEPGTKTRENPEKRVLEEPETSISNADLWQLLRRFNQEIYHVKSARHAPPHELDLNRADEEHFSPEKLRTTVQWFYLSVVVGLNNAGYRIWLVRSWSEPRLTGLLCAVYFIAWAWNFLIIALTAASILAIQSASFRSMFVPRDAGGYDDSREGSLHRAAHDSLTGAPEYYKGQTAEREATDLVRDIAEVALESARSEYDDESEYLENVAGSSKAARVADVEDDATKQEMMERVSKAMVQTIQIMSDVAEGCERLSNLLSPTSPFLLVGPRLRFVAILTFIAFISFVLSNDSIIKLTGFTIGLGFFGDPIFRRAIGFLNRKCPSWREYLNPNKNAQLTLTLLRIGEMSSSPLHLPASPTEEEDPWKMAVQHGKPGSILPAEALAFDVSGLPFPGLIKLVRLTIRMGIGLRLVFDHARAMTGIPYPPHLIQLFRRRGWAAASVGPLKFKARFDHKHGTAVIDSSHEPPVLYFSTHRHGQIQDLRLDRQHKGSVSFHIAIPNIIELQKTEQLGWKQKLVLELTGGMKHSVDGLIVRGKDSGQSFHLRAIKERDQLFNRLVAIGNQFWESV